MEIFKKHRLSYEKISYLLSGIYALFTLYSSQWFISDINDVVDTFVSRPFTGYLNYFPVWLTQFTLNVTPVICLLAAVKPGSLALRIFSFLFFYTSTAYMTSQGSNAYTGLLPSVWISFFAIFVGYRPNANRIYMHKQLIKVYLIAGALIVPYVLAGLWKLFYGGVYQFLWDEISIWHPRAMHYTMQAYIIRTDSSAWLLPFVNKYPWVTNFVFLYATVWEVLLIMVLWFPRLWKFVCLQVIIFHFITVWTLGILLFHQIGLFLLLYFINPLDTGEPLITFKIRKKRPSDVTL